MNTAPEPEHDAIVPAEPAAPGAAELPSTGIHMNGTGRAFTAVERRVLLAGLAVAFGYCIWLAATFAFAREHFHGYLGMTATHVLFGRAAGMAFGYALEYGHWIVVPVNMAIETVIVLLFYPLFVAGWRRLLIFDTLQRFMSRVREAAEANHGRIRRYGIPGLFVFVFIPFWMTGPVVGSVIGYLIGLRPWLNLTVVLGGTYVAIGIWGVLLKGMRDRAAEFGPYAPAAIVVLLALIAMIAHLLDRRRRTASRDG